MRKAKRSEQIAKLLIESVVPGATMSYRDPQAKSENDYDLRYADGRVVPVEVTESADFQIEAAVGALRGRRLVRVRNCRCDWLVYASRDARIDKIRAHADRYFAEIECAGLRSFYAQLHTPHFPCVRKIFDELRVDCGFTTVWDPPGRIGIAGPAQDEMVSVDSLRVLKAVELEAAKPDNRGKLAAFDTRERHLFVHIHPRNYPAWVSLLDADVPGEPPSLPDEITDIWVAAQDRSTELYVLWRYVAGQTWRDLGRVAVCESQLM